MITKKENSMKAKTRILLSVLGIFAWLISTNALVGTVHAASAQAQGSTVVSAGSKDSDHDGLTDAQEKACGTNPKVADSNRNGIRDGADDQDHDGLRNQAEFQHHTNCRSKDSDHDGVSDGLEVRHGSDPTKAEKNSGRDHPEDTPHPEDH
jgi:hypothetical protein